jgi:kinesin family member 2/24
MVSKLNPPQRSVTVEWYERGETKGKEVELDMLLELNPELIRGKSTYMEPPPSALPINLQRVSKFYPNSLNYFLCQTKDKLL